MCDGMGGIHWLNRSLEHPGKVESKKKVPLRLIFPKWTIAKMILDSNIFLQKVNYVSVIDRLVCK